MDPFPALADPVRRDLLRTLAQSPARVVDLAAGYPISRPAVSKHLRVLVDAGLVSAETQGRERRYTLVPGGLDPVRGLIDDLNRRPRFDESVLDGLDLEVRRTVRDHREATTSDPVEETA
ncbi:ArsR/SmtB family transcription factor [Cellulomonas humilata]|uniref:DNA-binding transcriptional ArsR family regulator n=1 Tax=Cellulomonas humilata TaxID=144055 RepID=A0ABU0E9T5_9CELL|nr:metalloregulator ArsR/SmtB family transcription factor [Cellulomonas humilata]MDQ0372020.1 DNA-binding transcriptional ArsR family regulator [Cellulomonas humilata]